MIINKVSSLDGHDSETYAVGEKEYRPWGYFEVLNAGLDSNEEFCEKKITLRPRQALSLQRHNLRQEFWRVEEGVLDVILDGKQHTLHVDDTIIIPLKSTHCMVNLTNDKVIVYERQTGICREADNDRLSDIGGRDTVSIPQYDIEASTSKEIYDRITKPLSS